MEDKELNEYSERLATLRNDGVNLISTLKQENAAAKRNKLLSAEDREKIISSNNEKIEKAKAVAEKNKTEIAEIVKAAVARNNQISKEQIAKVNAEQNEIIAKTE